MFYTLRKFTIFLMPLIWILPMIASQPTHSGSNLPQPHTPHISSRPTQQEVKDEEFHDAVKTLTALGLFWTTYQQLDFYAASNNPLKSMLLKGAISFTVAGGIMKISEYVSSQAVSRYGSNYSNHQQNRMKTWGIPALSVLGSIPIKCAIDTLNNYRAQHAEERARQRFNQFQENVRIQVENFTPTDGDQAPVANDANYDTNRLHGEDPTCPICFTTELTAGNHHRFACGHGICITCWPGFSNQYRMARTYQCPLCRQYSHLENLAVPTPNARNQAPEGENTVNHAPQGANYTILTRTATEAITCNICGEDNVPPHQQAACNHCRNRMCNDCAQRAWQPERVEQQFETTIEGQQVNEVVPGTRPGRCPFCFRE